METNDLNQKIIKNYQENEKMMILVFAQWCINNDLDPKELYKKAYPQQLNNDLLDEVLENNTLPKEESEKIENDTVLHALQLFGNDDLAFVVQNEIEKLGDKK